MQDHGVTAISLHVTRDRDTHSDRPPGGAPGAAPAVPGKCDRLRANQTDWFTEPKLVRWQYLRPPSRLCRYGATAFAGNHERRLEAAGVEPASESTSPWNSTCVSVSYFSCPT